MFNKQHTGKIQPQKLKENVLPGNTAASQLREPEQVCCNAQVKDKLQVS